MCVLITSCKTKKMPFKILSEAHFECYNFELDSIHSLYKYNYTVTSKGVYTINATDFRKPVTT